MAGRKKHRNGPDAPRKDGSVPATQKAKGAAQMAVGTALAAAGVPMCILPGPGVAAIVGGAALASRGQRNFSGREPSRIEERLDAAAEKAGTVAKEQAARVAHAAAREAPVIARKACSATGRGIVTVTKAAATFTVKGAKAVRNRMKK